MTYLGLKGRRLALKVDRRRVRPSSTPASLTSHGLASTVSNLAMLVVGFVSLGGRGGGLCLKFEKKIILFVCVLMNNRLVGDLHNLFELMNWHANFFFPVRLNGELIGAQREL